MLELKQVPFALVMVLHWKLCFCVSSDEDRHRHRHGREGSGVAPTALERRMEELERVRLCTSTVKMELHVSPTGFCLYPWSKMFALNYTCSVKNVFNISVGLRSLSAIFGSILNRWCVSSHGAVLTFLWKTSPSAPFLWNATWPNSVQLTLKCHHAFKPGTHSNSWSHTVHILNFHFSLGSISKASETWFFLAPYLAVVSHIFLSTTAL